MCVRRRILVALGAAALAAGATADATAHAAALAQWTPLIPQPGALDLTPPRSDGQLVAAANGTLSLLRGATLTPFARGPGGYGSSTGEPYIALSNHARLGKARCAFRRDDVFALEPSDQAPQVIRVGARDGAASPFASLMPGLFLAGIGFDTSGAYGRRLLVTATSGNTTTLLAIDCKGTVAPLAATAPLHVEGGIAIAPRSFGRFGGDLVAVDENGGDVIVFDRRGRGHTLVASGLPTGGDIGVEAVGFVPAHARASDLALLGDRGGQAQPHPGDDAFLGVRIGSLLRAGARRGDLLAATEGGAQTIAVRCSRSCRVVHVADGPPTAHAEGHIVFRRSG
jgi:hypothetical protein